MKQNLSNILSVRGRKEHTGKTVYDVVVKDGDRNVIHSSFATVNEAIKFKNKLIESGTL